jgi:ABC-type glycerol-3-phosphate transport system substrate-binding protein
MSNHRSSRLSSPLDRRRLLKGSAALGLATPALSSLVLRADAAPGSQSRSFASRAQSKNLKFYHDKAPWQDYFVKMSEKATEDIDIGWEPTPYSDTTSYQQVINSSLPTDEAPDVFTWWSGYRLETLYNSGNAADLTAVWQNAITAGDLPESLAAAFTFDDKQWGVPTHASYWVVFYNKKVYAEQGLSVPTTWDEFLANAETLKSNDVTPFFSTVDGRWPAFIWFEELLIRNDPQFYVDLCEGRAKYTDPTAVKAMEDWKGLFDKEYFTDLDSTMDAAAVASFQNGEFAHIVIGSWFQGQFLDAGLVPGEDYDAFLMPNIDPAQTKKVMIVETGGILVPAKAKDLEASTAVATWWDQESAQKTWIDQLGDTPANPKVQSDNPVLNGIVSTVATEGYELLQRYWEASPTPIVENAVDELARFMLNPDQAQSVLEAIQEIADAEWTKRSA